MSWSVSKTSGNPSAVKKAIIPQFANATACTASIPHEQATVELAAQIVFKQLDFMAENKYPAVTVEASGSCSAFNPAWSGSGTSVIKISVEPIYCFLEDPCPAVHE